MNYGQSYRLLRSEGAGAESDSGSACRPRVLRPFCNVLLLCVATTDNKIYLPLDRRSPPGGSLLNNKLYGQQRVLAVGGQRTEDGDGERGKK